MALDEASFIFGRNTCHSRPPTIPKWPRIIEVVVDDVF